MPAPYQTVLDTSGNPVSGALIYTYVAGTSTPATTYTDVALSVANTNPIVADSSGRFVAFLTPGSSYKFVYQDSGGGSIRTQDNVSAVPASSNNVDITGTAGEALTAGQAVYLSDGSGSKVAGQWYKADNGQAYSSTLPQVGIVTGSVAAGQSGTIRIAGEVTGLVGLTIGTTYYIGSSGALVTAFSTGNRRTLGVADTASSLVLTLNVYPTITSLAWANDFRVSLSSGSPVATSDVTGATSVFLTPYLGNRIDLPDASGNPIRITSAEVSVALPSTTATVYDVFAYLNGSACTLELVAWTNDTTRATAIARVAGRLLKSGDNTRLYVGSVRTTSVSGQSEDSVTKRYCFSQYNRVRRILSKTDATANWAYTTNVVRQANGANTNQVEAVIGVQDAAVHLVLQVPAVNSTGAYVAARIGFDAVSMTNTKCIGGVMGLNNTFASIVRADYIDTPVVGRHFFTWCEQSQAAGTTTWYGNSNPFGVGEQSGLLGWVEA